MEKYIIKEQLGDGTYGTVLKAINKESNEYVAIKKMKKSYTKWDECTNLKEVKALVGLNHPNIVTLKELVLSKNELNLIFEYIGINLYEFMTIQRQEIPELKIRNIIYQILQGLCYMHKNNFFHRDMKPENILLHEDIIKIADFGLAKEIHSKTAFTEYVATRWYRSPEVILKSKSYNSPIDIFAVGAIMVELYNNKPLFPGKSEFDQMAKICEILGTPSQTDWAEGYLLASKINYKFPNSKGYKLKNLIPRASENAIHLIENMLNFHPSKRLSAAQCLQHGYFQCFDILSIYGLRLNQSSCSVSNCNTNSISNKLSNSSLSNSNFLINNTPMKVSNNVQVNFKKKSSNVLSNYSNIFNANAKKSSHMNTDNNNITNNNFNMNSPFSLVNINRINYGVGGAVGGDREMSVSIANPANSSSYSQFKNISTTNNESYSNVNESNFNIKMNLNFEKLQKNKIDDM